MCANHLLTLEILPARKGDCLLMHYGTHDDRKMWLIDGGPSRVYKPVLKKRLKALRGDDPLVIELMMVSHHDDDHIKGLLDLCDEMETDKAEHRPLAYDIRNLWHNSFQNLAAIDEDPPTSVTAALAGQDEHDEMMLASVKQGHKLGDFARLFEWSVNQPFPAKIAGHGQSACSRVDRFDPLDITMVGPMQVEVEELREIYRKYLEELAEDAEEAALQMLASYADKSVANLSSIVCLVELGGKSILLTGDARGDKVLAGLEELGLIGEGKTLQVDVLKMPHHGSDRNIEPDFFENIMADHYVFCGDGSHGNPERATLEMLFGVRPATQEFTLHFNHPIADIDAKRKSEHEKHDDGSHPWNADEHELGTLLADQKSKCGAKFAWVEAEERGDILTIDLHEQLQV